VVARMEANQARVQEVVDTRQFRFQTVGMLIVRPHLFYCAHETVTKLAADAVCDRDQCLAVDQQDRFTGATTRTTSGGTETD